MSHSRTYKAVALSMLVLAAPIPASGGAQETAPPPNVADVDARHPVDLNHQPRAGKGATIRRVMAVQQKDGSIARSTQLSFPGGPLSDYIDLLCGSFPEESVVLAPGVAGFRIPPVQLRTSSIGPALDVVCNYEGMLVFTDPEKTGQKAILVNELIHPGIHRINATPVTSRAIRASPRGSERNGVDPDERTTLVYSIRSMLQDSGMRLEDIEGTLKVAAEISGSGKVEIRYFEPTSMLFISGGSDQTWAVSNAFEVLEQTAATMAQEKWMSDRKKKNKEEKADTE
jgi:hypothetical protein